MRKAWMVGLVVALLDGALVAWWLASREPSDPPTASGVVLDPDGRPVLAGVWRLPWFRHEPDPWITDERGCFVLPLVNGSFGLCALGPQQWAESEAVEIDGSKSRSIEGVVLRLQRPARVTGTVVDDADEPVANFLVICVSGSLVANDTEPTAYTDEEGRFAFDRCDPGQASIAGHRFFLAEGEAADVVVRVTAAEAREARERRR